MKIDRRKTKTLTLPENTCICRQSDCTIPYGLCHCGCGQKTNIARQGRSDRGEISGYPQRYLPYHGHTGKARVHPRTDGICMCGEANCRILRGQCHCGCGQITKICDFTHRRRGWIKGEPQKFLNGHNQNTAPRKTIVGCVCGDKECRIPYGFCHCGCGGKTTIPKKSNRRTGDIGGVPKKWIRFHSTTTAEIGIKNRQHLARLKRERKGYIGVTMTKNVGKPWRSTIGQAGSLNFEDLGTFATEEEAGRAYDAVSVKRYGNSAQLNFPDEYPAWQESQKIRTAKEKEIAWRLLNTDATTTTIGKELGCSASKLSVMWRNYTTKEQRVEATSRKVGKQNIGRPMNPQLAAWIKEHEPANKGKPMNPELKEKLRKINTGRKHSLEQRIKKSALLQGITVEEWTGFASSRLAQIKNSNEYKTWRKAVYERDDWTCQHCKKRGGRLHAHHIKPKSQYPELMFDVPNGLTLCESCHHNVHTKMEEARHGISIDRHKRGLINRKGEENERACMVLNCQ